MMQAALDRLIDIDLAAMQGGRELEKALVSQKGYVTYYSKDRDPLWLTQLEVYHKTFEAHLARLRNLVTDARGEELVRGVESAYSSYSRLRNEVISLYDSAGADDGYRLQTRIRPDFLALITLCDRLVSHLQEKVDAARVVERRRVAGAYAIALVTLAGGVLVGVLLTYVLSVEILGPIRKLALNGATPDVEGPLGNEVAALSKKVNTLIEDADQTRRTLTRSRVAMEQAEKWALVGKLAAGVAHSIRNPLTSVKMRLFSMERSLNLDENEKDDFEVISEEIRHIDAIVTNFLEFARPPKLKMQSLSPSDVVDTAVRLLRRRLESYDVKVKVERQGRLPKVSADADQLKEVLVNMMVNSCEAMVEGGSIIIRETTVAGREAGRWALIQISDTGPGVPKDYRDRIFHPFFSTKEEGTGLGLSIAARVIEEHGGWIDLESGEDCGAVFTIGLAVVEQAEVAHEEAAEENREPGAVRGAPHTLAVGKTHA
jgi:signal transduction histidine kinase